VQLSFTQCVHLPLPCVSVSQQYPSVVVSYGLKAMQYGSGAAAQQVPRILQVLELYPETMDQFEKKVRPFNKKKPV